MTILVTGASGHLGRLIVESLLARGAAPTDIVAGARTVEKAADLAEKGVRVVPLDYDDPHSVAAALEDVDTVALVSGSEVGKRFQQHSAVIDAAVAAGVGQLIYTSLTRATESPLVLAPEHVQTEQAIRASGLPYVILRNDWYSENYAQDLAAAAQSGEVTASVGDARVASASRRDFAEAVAVVALEDGHIDTTYELAGDVAWDYDDLAAAMGEVLGREVVYRRIDTAAQIALLTSFGLDEGTAGFVAALDAGIAAGALDSDDTTLSRLIGRPTTPLVETLRTLV